MSYSAFKLLAVEFHYIFFIPTEHESSPSDDRKRTDKTQNSTQLAALLLCWKTIIISGLPNTGGFILEGFSKFIVLYSSGVFSSTDRKVLYCREGKQISLKDIKLSSSYIHFTMYSSLLAWDCQNWDKCLASPVRKTENLYKTWGGKATKKKSKKVEQDLVSMQRVSTDCAVGAFNLPSQAPLEGHRWAAAPHTQAQSQGQPKRLHWGSAQVPREMSPQLLPKKSALTQHICIFWNRSTEQDWRTHWAYFCLEEANGSWVTENIVDLRQRRKKKMLRQVL